MRTSLLLIVLIRFTVSHAQNFDSANRIVVENYIKALPKSCTEPVSELSIRKRKVDFERDKCIMEQCSKVFASPDWWNEFKKLTAVGLQQTESTFSNGVFIYTLSFLKNEHKNLHIYFTIFADRDKVIDSLEMYIGTNTDTYCGGEYPSAINFFDVFYLKRLLPFIRFAIYLRPDSQAAHYYYKSLKSYHYDFVDFGDKLYQ